MEQPPDYEEYVSSGRTEALFIALTLFFLILFLSRAPDRGIDGWSLMFAAISAVFLFYSINYRTLRIRIGSGSVQLCFGLFRWLVPEADIQSVFLDTSSLWRIGGAGIHFSFFAGRYRALFNFLEHSRVVIQLKRKKGPVEEISFSTARPERVLNVLQRWALPADDGEAIP